MKKVLIYLIFFIALFANIYLIFYWEPQSKNGIQEKASKETLSYSTTLYKVGKEKALEQLSDNDKKDLEKIINKLSAFDIGKIKDYYADSNEDEGIVDIFSLLKKRLATEDYKKIEEISNSFLDIKGIEKEIKK